MYWLKQNIKEVMLKSLLIIDNYLIFLVKQFQKLDNDEKIGECFCPWLSIYNYTNEMFFFSLFKILSNKRSVNKIFIQRSNSGLYITR